MDAPPEKESLESWLDIARRLLAAGVNAPVVMAEDREQGFLLLSDLGRGQLLAALDESSVEPLYAAALDSLFTMQSTVAPADLPDYDEERLLGEMALLPAWFLERHLGYTPTSAESRLIQSTFRALIENALEQTQCFVHRDFHSRNLLLGDDARPGVIDFQDAVRGPITYDLVSLLRDCYIAWPEERVYRWLEDYRLRLFAVGLTRADDARFRRWFDLMGLQRHIKVLGIFARLWYRDGKCGYLNDLPLVWRYTLDIGIRYPETRRLIELLAERIGDRDLTQPAAALASAGPACAP